jgi:hypothetical protein
MQRILLFSFIALLAGCGSSSKKLMNLPPLDRDAPVQAFWSEPNVKYEKVCEIKASGNNSLGPAYREKEDFEKMFKNEARKCGANAFIFQWLSGFKQGDVEAHALGIRIVGASAGVDVSEESVKAWAYAVQGNDVNKVQELLAKVPKDPAARAPTDDILLNSAVYLVSARGLTCDKKMVSLLMDDYKAYLTKFEGRSQDRKTFMCGDVVSLSLPKMKDQTEAVRKTNDEYVGLMNLSGSSEKEIAAFNKSLVVVGKIIADECVKAPTSATCALKGAFVDIATKTKASKSAAAKKNSKDLLKALGEK